MDSSSNVTIEDPGENPDHDGPNGNSRNTHGSSGESSDTFQRRPLPEYFYRITHETSHTMSCYTDYHCWTQMDDHDGMFDNLNAFQALGSFAFMEHMNNEMVVRHLRGSLTKPPPSVYISAFDGWGNFTLSIGLQKHTNASQGVLTDICAGYTIQRSQYAAGFP